jgi:predicted GTPase
MPILIDREVYEFIDTKGMKHVGEITREGGVYTT